MVLKKVDNVKREKPIAAPVEIKADKPATDIARDLLGGLK
jgi:hypothetical protein